MSATATPASRPRPSGPATLVTVALVIGIAWALAQWTWALLAPPPASTAAPVAAATLDRTALAALFGGAPTGASVSGTDPATGLRLKGVVAATKADAGAAVFNAGGKDFAVRSGEEIRPGIRLAGVLVDHVLVERAGVRGRVDLEVWTAGAPARAPGSRAPGFRLGVTKTGTNAYTFSRKELDEALRDPGQLSFLGRIGLQPGGGVRLEGAPGNSLAARLGLKAGDVIRKVNGQSVTSAGDLARLHQQFATTSLIQADVQRGAQTLQLSYTIAP